ncbi:MAG: hypothetical protein HOP28_02790 [Gemmatimonadales bacterium]|nr:hypothetical protein [Gemmatimonadales bacterium]
MSRAFVSEDAGGPDPRHRFPLPPRDDPGFAEAAARALLRGADQGDSESAELATGYLFGDPALIPQVRRLLDEARKARHDRMEQLAERYLERATPTESPPLD